jgi:tRNA (adenine57-N1/adenine58-N1)-methyltransferase
MSRVKENEPVLLVDASGRSQIVVACGGIQATEFGVIDLKKVVGMEYGSAITIGDVSLKVLPPSNLDVFHNIKRKAQVITPKDAAQIIFRGSIHSGDIVVEGGSGSGALTIWLAWTVAPDGKVYSYDINEEHLQVAKRNVERFGISNVFFIRKDVCLEIEQRADAVVLDIAEPWRAVKTGCNALFRGGHMVCFVPTFNQIEQTVREMRKSLIDVHAFEIIEREIHVGDRSSRPGNIPIGHTGFIAVGRRP